MAHPKSNFNCINIPGAGPIIRSDQGETSRATADAINLQKDNSEVFSVDYKGLPDPAGGGAKRQIMICLGDIVADSDALEYYLCTFVVAVTLTNIYIAVDADTEDGSTNKQTLLFQTDDDTQVASYTTPAENPGLDGATWTTVGDLDSSAVAATVSLEMLPTKVSSGLDLSNLTILIEYNPTA